jgi:hypothetical protein
MTTMKIFGKEPALWLALLYASVVMFSGFVLPLSVDQQGCVNAVGAALVGLLTAISVDKDGLSAAIIGFIKAGLALGLAFGLHLTPEKQSIAMTFAAAVVAMFVRTQVTVNARR